MLVEELDPQVARGERADDLAERMRPLIGRVVHGGRLELGVRALLHGPVARALVEVAVLDRQVVVAEDLGDRVELDEVQAPAGREQRRHDVRPAVDVLEPVQRADAGVDDVEPAPAERLVGAHDVAHHPVRLEARARGQLGRRLHRGRGEVQSGDLRAQARPRQRVEAEVALQVHERQTVHVAELLWLERPQRRGTGQEAVDVVEVAPRVDRDALVPERPVELGRHSSASSAVISPTLALASPKSIAVFSS